MRKIVLWLSLFVVVLLCIVSSKKLAEIEKREALINEANDCLATGDWKCAEKNVRELLKAEPNDSNLQMHMAGIFFEQERYKECVQYIESLNFRNEDLNYLVEKSNLLEKEMESLGVEKSMHFRLEFDGRPSKKDVMEALAVLEVAYDSISNLFGFMPENKISVVLYEAVDYQGVGERPDWVAAVFDGKLRVPVNMMAYREVYRPVLFHELTHAFVRAMTRAHVPLWMNEGIAQVIGASKKEVERPSGDAPSLKSLTEPFVNESNTATAIKLYWYSLRMVENMLSRGGGSEEAFRKFAKCLQDLRKLKTDEALQKYFGTTSKELLESVR
ncbi:MAG: hypothetical protein IKS96_06610 [Fibrobacter sp.]|nr:hypothetical protein [Fibrobacter sp.]